MSNSKHLVTHPSLTLPQPLSPLTRPPPSHGQSPPPATHLLSPLHSLPVLTSPQSTLIKKSKLAGIHRISDYKCPVTNITNDLLLKSQNSGSITPYKELINNKKQMPKISPCDRISPQSSLIHKSELAEVHRMSNSKCSVTNTTSDLVDESPNYERITQ